MLAGPAGRPCWQVTEGVAQNLYICSVITEGQGGFGRFYMCIQASFQLQPGILAALGNLRLHSSNALACTALHGGSCKWGRMQWC